MKSIRNEIVCNVLLISPRFNKENIDIKKFIVFVGMIV